MRSNSGPTLSGARDVRGVARVALALCHHVHRSCQFLGTYRLPPFTSLDMPRASRNSQKHRSREHGFEVCNHTCQKSVCISSRSKTIFWPKEGNSCGRHARNMSLHPGCRAPCPVASKHFARNADPSEYGGVIRDMLDRHRSPRAIDEFFSRHITDWRRGRANWPEIPPSWYVQTCYK